MTRARPPTAGAVPPSDVVPYLRDAGPADEHGRGMRLIDTLADRWGILREREVGTAV
jgi:hypothetical protein